MKRKSWVFLILTIFLLGLAVGCGDNKGKESGAGVSAKKIIKIGTNPNFAPFEYLDEKGEMAGFDIDLAKALGKAMDVEIEMKNMAFDGLIPALQTGNLDMAITGMTITEERKKSIRFSDPYYQSGLAVVVLKEDTTIQNATDLAGKKIAVQIGTTGSLAASEIKNAQVKDFNNTPETFMELKNKGVDAVINDLPVVQYFLKTEEGKAFKQVSSLLKTEYVGIGIDPNQKELVEKVNKALNKIKENGEYEKIYVKWFGVKPNWK